MSEPMEGTRRCQHGNACVTRPAGPFFGRRCTCTYWFGSSMPVMGQELLSANLLSPAR